MKSRPLKTQFQLTFALIILTSIAATIITYAAAAVLYVSLEYQKVYPADYYEKQLPEIEDYIRKENTALLMLSAKDSLEKKIPLQGIGYQVLDGKCNILYGTIKEKIIQDTSQLYTQINIRTEWQKHFLNTVPIIGNDGRISGAVLLSYQIKMSYTENSNVWWLTLLFIVALISPFLYIVVFTLVFSRIFTDNINKPLQFLMDASHKISQKDIDFEIDYHAKNELGRLCDAFSEMKEELKKSLSAQWKMEQERVEMVESLAHDLKSPLSVISIYTESLMNANISSDEKSGRYLAVIKQNADKSSALVKQMQYTSDLERADVQLHLVPVKLSTFLKQKVHHYELQARQKGVDMVIKIQDELQIPILIDADKLERILDNIVSNSLRYTPTGGRISISVKVEKENIFYEIYDSGSGFSQKDIEKAFDKFYRGDEARTSIDGHSGLGLYIVKKLVEQLDGSIKVYNTESGGACVAFRHAVFNSCL